MATQRTEGLVNANLRFRLISCVILIILFLQAFAVVFRTGPKGWPFADYPMYSNSFEEGDRLEVSHKLYATLADSSEVPIGPDSIGLREPLWWIFRRWVILPLDPEYKFPHEKPKRNSWLRKLTGGEPDSAERPSVSRSKLEEAAISRVVDSYRQHHGKEIVALRLEDDGIIVTRDGMKTAPPKVLWIRAIADPAKGGP